MQGLLMYPGGSTWLVALSTLMQGAALFVPHPKSKVYIAATRVMKSLALSATCMTGLFMTPVGLQYASSDMWP
jgi:hypothetical protein